LRDVINNIGAAKAHELIEQLARESGETNN
jgi:hypothetical protein